MGVRSVRCLGLESTAAPENPWKGAMMSPLGPRGVAPSFLVDQQGLTFREGWTWQFAHRRPGGFDEGR